MEKKTCSEFNVLILLLKGLLSSEDFINDLTDSYQVMRSPWQTGVTNARLEFSGEARFLHFTGFATIYFTHFSGC